MARAYVPVSSLAERCEADARGSRVRMVPTMLPTAGWWLDVGWEGTHSARPAGAQQEVGGRSLVAARVPPDERTPMTTVAEHLITSLAQAGVRQVWGVVGDALNPLTDAIRREDRIEWIGCVTRRSPRSR
ncbi:hypothetical protein GCM10023258_19520 [Terrabacter aeriphilus]|uniref:Thiamine pyrophosphate enzyme N-terminal TPP-binding domain-containing protein n=1 Tax=Terrabacter aeriphilus TaxID=515662 RepID=A0ABP9JCM5_9MICO